MNTDQETPETIDGDRQESAIANTKPYKGLAIGLGLVAIVALPMLLTFGANKQPQDQQASFSENFSTGVNANLRPRLPEEPVATQDTADSAPPMSTKDKLKERQAQALLQHALEQAARAKAAEDKARQARNKAPLFVINNASNTGTAQSSDKTQELARQASLQAMLSAEAFSKTAPAGAADPNIKLLNDSMNSGTKPAIQASRLSNLSSLLAQGTLIDGVMESAVDSGLTGMVRAIVSRNVYSFDNSQILIPAGGRLIGQYQTNVMQGQNRVFVVWDRMLRADGVSAQLSSIGTDALGRSGLAGDVDSKFMQRFGSAILLSIIDSALTAAADSAKDDADVTISNNNGASRAAEIALKNSINIKPSIHVDQGTSIKIFVSQDIDFSNVDGWQSAHR